ncbi:gamma-glutamyl-gamma-aminobutyrate hydrolase family protein [Niallia oryzisoli]|uniref:gamma-glutamyl-gamma-aminobutyrate hydrolase family protein n=1 Tax=Niallia oryzisoli TaxID=1737571 RepID=UPI0037360CCC
MSKKLVGFVGRHHYLKTSSDPLDITFLASDNLTFFQKLGYHTVVIDSRNNVDIIDRLDVLALVGGFEDIDPSLYGAERHPLTAGCNKSLDEFEISAFHFARKKGIPIIGICRGFQLINVALGGTLYQDTSLIHTDIQHHTGKYTEPAHQVKTTGWLKDVIGEKPAVNSYHHQGIDQLASDLTPLAWAEDGVIEAYELKDSTSPLFAVQWHPELLKDELSFRLVETYLNKSLNILK